MRRGLLLGAALGLVDALAVLLAARLLDGPRDIGWYSYEPMPRRYADYLPASHTGHGWVALGLVAALLVAVNAALVGGYLFARRRRSAAG